MAGPGRGCPARKQCPHVQIPRLRSTLARLAASACCLCSRPGAVSLAWRQPPPRPSLGRPARNQHPLLLLTTRPLGIGVLNLFVVAAIVFRATEGPAGQRLFDAVLGRQC